jgi:hypothetical protein
MRWTQGLTLAAIGDASATSAADSVPRNRLDPPRAEAAPIVSAAFMSDFTLG